VRPGLCTTKTTWEQSTLASGRIFYFSLQIHLRTSATFENASASCCEVDGSLNRICNDGCRGHNALTLWAFIELQLAYKLKIHALATQVCEQADQIALFHSRKSGPLKGPTEGDSTFLLLATPKACPISRHNSGCIRRARAHLMEGI
jgi:hypothetical protein